MPRSQDPITLFYLEHLTSATLQGKLLQAPCPFCGEKKDGGRLVVFLNPESYFHGYFRCLNRCLPGGFPLHFAEQAGISGEGLPGYDPDRESLAAAMDYPSGDINNEIKKFTSRLTQELLGEFKGRGIGREALTEMMIGYNGRYLVYPYFQADGNCYSARCIHPERPEDSFWYGDEELHVPKFQIFNIADIDRCVRGALFVVEGEDNLLTLKQLGLPGVAVSTAGGFDHLDAALFSAVETIFLVAINNPAASRSARNLAIRLGYKARIIRWPDNAPRDFSLCRLALEKADAFRETVFQLIRQARSFSPFSSPAREFSLFTARMQRESGEHYRSPSTGFTRLDQALEGMHGINIMGGPPKTGKSCFFIQIATDMARRNIPVIYYDFENSRQKIYQRTLCRLSRLAEYRIKAESLDSDEQKRLAKARTDLRQLLTSFRVVTDRALTPEIMRRHIDFLRHETRNERTVVVVDSLHKLPFADISERRSGIDGWLRHFEAMRDELDVSFLVISELSRDAENRFSGRPHLGSFKGSGDIAYSADNALILVPDWDPFENSDAAERTNTLWLVASREHSPGRVAGYRLDFPYWGFEELPDLPGSEGVKTEAGD